MQKKSIISSGLGLIAVAAPLGAANAAVAIQPDGVTTQGLVTLAEFAPEDAAILSGDKFNPGGIKMGDAAHKHSPVDTHIKTTNPDAIKMQDNQYKYKTQADKYRTDSYKYKTQSPY